MLYRIFMRSTYSTFHSLTESNLQKDFEAMADF